MTNLAYLAGSYENMEMTASIYAQTWGLPTPSLWHKGTALYVNGHVQEIDFENLDGLWMCEQGIQDYFYDRVGSEGVFIFEGKYKIHKNGNCQMSGEIKKIEIADLLAIGKKVKPSEYDINKERKKDKERRKKFW